jgi:cellulose synthase/poly-beta-1,6-N-acetylglucosamine synthase-like glycosyltransferase
MLIKNLVRARGLYRLGGGITLFGTGMAFPWRIFAQAELATSKTVEDLHLAVLLAGQGTRVHFCEGLRVTSAAAELRDSLDQRRRWEHGFLTNALRHAVPLLLRGLWRRSRHHLFLGAHLLVPPLALLFLVASAALVPAILLAASSGTAGPALVLAGALVFAMTLIGIAWYREGRAILGLLTVVRAPLYVLWKIPLYLGFVSSRQTEWNRTRRPSEEG